MEEATRQTETRHTPGPWRCEPQPGQTVGKHTYTHCVMYGDDSIADTLTEPDARLIAASPDLLAACEAVLDAYNTAHPNWSVVANQCAAAVRKATGGAA